MYENVIYNRHMFYRDKFYDYKNFCERITLVKSKCHPPPPPDFPFMRERPKKQEMEKERQKQIDFNKDLLIKKYKYMYKNHNQYHPSNLKFQPHPSSLKLSHGTAQYYELCNNNKYMGNKIKEVQRSKGNYNSSKSLQHYKKLRYLGDEMVKSSKYNNNILLKLVTPFTYEKRLNRILATKSATTRKLKKNNNNMFYQTSNRFNTDNVKNNKIPIIKINNNPNKFIEIERENIITN